MAKGLVTLMALLLSTVACAAPPPGHKEADAAMDFVCARVPVSCKGIADPIIVTTEMVDMYSYMVQAEIYGLTIPYEPYVFIDPHLTLIGVDPMSIIIHETVHYVLFMADHPRATDLCYSEELARRIEAQYSEIEYTDAWRDWYGCTQTEPVHVG